MTENTQRKCNIYLYYLHKRKKDFQRQLAIWGILFEPVQKRKWLWGGERTITKQRKLPLKLCQIKYLNTMGTEQQAISLPYS